MDLHELADRTELRGLVERYALAADRRQAATVAALFAEDAVLVVPRVPDTLVPTVERRGREAIESAMAGLSRYPATFHAVVGHVVDLDGDRASGTTSCLAHHVSPAGQGGGPASGGPHDLAWALHYDDRYVRQADGWRFAERRLTVAWVEDRPVWLVG